MSLRNFLLRGVSPVFAPPGDDGAPDPTPPADGAAPPAGDDAPPADGSQPPADGAAPPAGDDPPATEDWKDRQIRRQHARLQDEKRQKAELQAELEATRAMLNRTGGAAPAGGEQPPAAPAADDDQPAAGVTQEAVRAEARRMRDQEKFNEDSTKADKDGSKRFGANWTKATDTLRTLGGFDVETMQQVLATDDPAKLLYELGTNPDKYHEVMDLPPYKRFAEMVKLAAAPAPKPAARKPSDAPPPVDSLRGQNRGDPNDLRDDLTDDEWYARRQRQKAARFAARQAAR